MAPTINTSSSLIIISTGSSPHVLLSTVDLISNKRLSGLFRRLYPLAQQITAPSIPDKSEVRNWCHASNNSSSCLVCVAVPFHSHQSFGLWRGLVLQPRTTSHFRRPANLTWAGRISAACSGDGHFRSALSAVRDSMLDTTILMTMKIEKVC